MDRPESIDINLQEALFDGRKARIEVESYIEDLEKRAQRLEDIENHLNKAEDDKNTAVVDWFKDFKTS